MRAVYGKIRKVLSPTLKGRITRSLYALGVKPTCSTESSNLEKGVVTFSADFEMAWAFRFSKKHSQNAEVKGLVERENVPIILKHLEGNRIPVTWATVGHLMLDSCKKVNNKCHAEMVRPVFFENKNWRYAQGDWYQHDPGTNYEEDPAWYAPDLIQQITRSSVKHEIGCHTFSHIDMTYKNCPKILAESEIKACKNLAKKIGVKLESMVFPGGTLGNYEVLKGNGFICYRKPMKYDIALPFIDVHGLVAIPSAWGLDKSDYDWSHEVYIKMARSYIKAAAKTRKVVHFWFHPSMDSWYLEKVFPNILELVSLARKKGQIEVLTMGQLAKKTLKNNGFLTEN